MDVHDARPVDRSWDMVIAADNMKAISIKSEHIWESGVTALP